MFVVGIARSLAHNEHRGDSCSLRLSHQPDHGRSMQWLCSPGAPVMNSEGALLASRASATTIPDEPAVLDGALLSEVEQES